MPSLSKQTFFDVAVRIFYALSFCILIQCYTQISLNWSRLGSADWLWPIAWFRFFRWDSSRLILVYFYLVGSFIAAAFFPRPLVSRLNAFYAWMVLFALISSFGKVDHTYMGWPVVAFFLLFFSPARQARNAFVIYLAHCYIFSNYFAAGLWKVRAMMIPVFFKEPGFVLEKTLLEQMAHGIAEGSQKVTIVFTLFSQYQVLSALAWILVILLQMSAIFGVFYPNKAWMWGALFISFHLGTQVFLGVVFVEHTFLLVYLFYILPSLNNASFSGQMAAVENGTS
jgi:hypothetical protein